MPNKSQGISRRDVCCLITKTSLWDQSKWHWFSYHFAFLLDPRGEHPFAMAIIDALVICDSVMPGYARIFIDRFSSVCGKEKYVPHYEQLMQMIAELHVVTQLARFDWPGGAKFLMEPTAAGSEKNPEITIEHQQATYGIEVKAPSLQKHIKSRNENGTQIPGRMPLEMMEHLTSGDTIVTLPRDNPVKDFLISANSKFEHFKQGDTHFFGVLVIVWDDFIYEPITSLISQSSGLFTSASFYKDENDVAVPFKSVDGVFIIRMLHQFYCESKDQPLIDGRSDIMDYGEEGQFPFKVFIQNPNGTMVPTSLQLSLQGLPYAKEMGAEYTSKDLVWWIP